MLALIMAGGRGTRLGCNEKPLALLNGRPLISYVIDAFSGYEVLVATSDNTPYTKNWCRALGIEVVRSDGEGYCEDLFSIVRELEEKAPLFTSSSDLPTVSRALIEEIRSAFWHSRRESCSVWTPVSVYDNLGLGRPDSCDIGHVVAVASGLNIIDGRILERAQTELQYLTKEPDCLVNLNTPEEYAALEWWFKDKDDLPVEHPFQACTKR
jgi:GTP:adenosylcobinamide-phosphate guanylyltransferase